MIAWRRLGLGRLWGLGFSRIACKASAQCRRARDRSAWPCLGLRVCARMGARARVRACVQVVCNPYSGGYASLPIAKSTVLPILRLAGHEVMSIDTQYFPPPFPPCLCTPAHVYAAAAPLPSACRRVGG